MDLSRGLGDVYKRQLQDSRRIRRSVKHILPFKDPLIRR
jgi:hypothetical protein